MNFLDEYEAELRKKTEQQLEKEAFDWSCLPHHVERYKQALIASKYPGGNLDGGATVKALRELLANYPDDMVVIVDRHSDYAVVASVQVIDAVDKGTWLMRTHPTMCEESKAGTKQYLLIE